MTERVLPDVTSAHDDLVPLVVAAQRGDGTQRAFVELHRRFRAAVHGIALAHVGPSDADDVTQEVFVRVHRTLSSLREPAAFAAWICTLARNAAKDALRRRKSRPATEQLGDDVPARAERTSPADDAEARDRVLSCLAKLPETYRETLLMRLAEGLSGPEIAERTGMTPGSVRVNLCRGMAILRPLLLEEGLS